jgi:hypothetical protein
VSELDEAWAAALAEAENRARSSGRADLVDYLSLKNSNDLLRKAGVEWLVERFTILGRGSKSGGCQYPDRKPGWPSLSPW